MDKEVFAKSEFAEYATKNLVLVEVDFPSKKPQPAALKKANQALKEKYSIEAFPTLVVFDREGKKLGEEVGYRGPKALIAKLEKYRKR